MKDKLAKARRKIDGIDRKMAKLFADRMNVMSEIARYKHEHGLEIQDTARETEVLKRNSELVPEKYMRSYTDFLKKLISLSKEEQADILTEMDNANGVATVLKMRLGENSYPIIIGKGLIGSADEYFNLDRKAFIVTDDGVPMEYADTVRSLCRCATVYTVKAGEGSKSFDVLQEMLKAMSDFHLDRGDCVIAVGGGVVGDLAGFASSVYMRGVDFYNVPTTLLSQVDASVGGKTAINLCGVKNTVGAFKQPNAVLVDVGVLETLPKRHMRNGMAEVIKMAAVANEKLFAALENSSEEDTYNNIADIITEAVKIKRDIVEADEKESGLRKILNFGHTLGHAIEESERCDRLHGECVAIGMIPVSLADAKNRISSLLQKYSLPTSHDVDSELISRGIAHDKKAKGGKISIIFCPQIGKYCIKNMTAEEFTSIIE